MSMRWNPAIMIACALVIGAGLILWWQYKYRPVAHVNALRARAEHGDPKRSFIALPPTTAAMAFLKAMQRRYAGTKWQPIKGNRTRRMVSGT